MDENHAVKEADRIHYAGELERIKLRIDEAERIIQEIGDERGIVYAATQLRLTLEEIAFASLVGNRMAMEEAMRSISINSWDKASKSLRAINPNYWPCGVTEIHGEVHEWLDVTDGLPEPDVAKIWGRLSQLVHARNPWSDAPDLKAEKAFIIELIGRLRATLSSHFITLVSGQQRLFCQVWSSPVRVYLFGLVDDDDATGTEASAP